MSREVWDSAWRLRHLFLCFAMLTGCASVPAKQLPLSVCSILAAPKDYDQRELLLTVRYSHGLIYGTPCSQAIGLIDSGNVAHTSIYENFEQLERESQNYISRYNADPNSEFAYSYEMTIVGRYVKDPTGETNGDFMLQDIKAMRRILPHSN